MKEDLKSRLVLMVDLDIQVLKHIQLKIMPVIKILVRQKFIHKHKQELSHVVQVILVKQQDALLVRAASVEVILILENVHVHKVQEQLVDLVLLLHVLQLVGLPIQVITLLVDLVLVAVLVGILIVHVIVQDMTLQ